MALRRAARRLVVIPGELTQELGERRGPSSRLRTMSSVQRSPSWSRARATEQNWS